MAALGLAGAVAIAIVAGIVALHALADPERLRKDARDKARVAWGRELAMKDVSFSLFPYPRLVASDVSLANPSWAKERELAHADRVIAGLALLPLLTGKLHVERVRLEGARLDLEVAQDGARSWEMHPAPDAPKSTPATRAEWPHVRALAIVNGEIRYRAQGGAVATWRVANAKAKAGAGMRDAELDAVLSRNGHALHAVARFADLSRIDQPGATSKGTVELDWGKTRAVLEGEIPLDREVRRGAFRASLESRSLDDMLGFFALRERHTAPLKARADVVRTADAVELHSIDITLGSHRATGELQLPIDASTERFSGRIESGDLDWKQALLDAGDEAPPPPPPGELFPVRPLPWPMLGAMRGKHGTIDFNFARLLLPDGIELRNATGRATIDGERMEVKPLAAHLLGGSATASIVLEAPKRSVRVELDAKDVLLERWFHERRRPVRFKGGPMKVRAQLSAAGTSMKELAASMTGPVSIVMGPGVYASKGAGDWEALMVRFSKKDSAGEIDFECAGASLPFVAGRASGKDIIGARSHESRLLVSGNVDFRGEDLELRGPLRAKPGEGVGLVQIADDLLIAGAIRKPKVQLDPKSKPKVIARAAAAVATAGITVLAGAASDASRRDPDPCEAVFAQKHPSRH